MMNNKQIDELIRNCHEHKREWCDGDTRAPWAAYLGRPLGGGDMEGKT